MNQYHPKLELSETTRFREQSVSLEYEYFLFVLSVSLVAIQVLASNVKKFSPLMIKTPRQRICNVLFVVKATISILLGCALLGYQGFLTYEMYVKGRRVADQRLGPVVIDPTNRECQFNGNSRLEPPSGRIILGFHLDWAQLTPIQAREQLGFTPGVINAFLRFDPTIARYVDYDMLEWHAQEVQQIGGSLAVTFEPSALTQITDQMISELADRCLLINSKYGVPLFVRWGHEMNGNLH
jgi:hypothetical protein